MPVIIDLPRQLDPTVHDAITDPVFEARFAACATLTATVWAWGLAACRTHGEQTAWLIRYQDHYARVLAEWALAAQNQRWRTNPTTRDR